MPGYRSFPCPKSRLCFVFCELAGAMGWHCEKLSLGVAFWISAHQGTICRAMHFKSGMWSG
jgi:hypothetical protein